MRRWAASRLLDAAYQGDALGDRASALRLYRESVEAWPDDVTAQVDFATALARAGETFPAMQHVFSAVRLNPDSGAARHLYGNLLASVGNPESAAEQLREAVRIAPADAVAHNDLGQSLAIAGRTADALAQFREAMRLREGWAAPMIGAALLLATAPGLLDAPAAVKLSERAASITRRGDPGVLQILAVSYAAAGKLTEAVAAQRAVVDLATASGDRRLAAEAQAALDGYRQRAGAE
jgi:tetratricopeptide (TPR) repeat protein